jgi:hypothetical protein
MTLLMPIAEACEALTVLIDESYYTAKDKGWWEDPDRNVMEQLCLFHCEISEAAEEYRSGGLDALTQIEMNVDGKEGKPGGFPVELADLLIRVFDTCGRYGIPLGEALRLKLIFNRTRPHRHGGKVA